MCFQVYFGKPRYSVKYPLNHIVPFLINSMSGNHLIYPSSKMCKFQILLTEKNVKQNTHSLCYKN